MRKILDNVLIAIAVIGMLAFLVGCGFATVYFRSGLVAEYGEWFADAVIWSVAFGWMVPFAAMGAIDRRIINS